MRRPSPLIAPYFALMQPNLAATDYRPLIRQAFAEMEKVVIGQRALINRLLIGVFTGGHILLEGVPGLAKRSP